MGGLLCHRQSRRKPADFMDGGAQRAPPGQTILLAAHELRASKVEINNQLSVSGRSGVLECLRNIGVSMTPYDPLRIPRLCEGLFEACRRSHGFAERAATASSPPGTIGNYG